MTYLPCPRCGTDITYRAEYTHPTRCRYCRGYAIVGRLHGRWVVLPGRQGFNHLHGREHRST